MTVRTSYPLKLPMSLKQAAQRPTPADLFPFLTNARREAPVEGDKLP